MTHKPTGRNRTRHTVEQTLDRLSADPYDVAANRHRLEAQRDSDLLDEARRSEDAAVAVQELNARWKRARQARHALDRLRSGHYGVCESCGGAIGDARLDAVPWATRCIRCEAAREEIGRGDEKAGSPLPDWLDRTFDAA